jgi:hypothetical protein
MMVTVKIENAYSDGHESEREVLIAAPTGDVQTWFEEVVYEYTGDGHGIGFDGGSCYIATVIAADDPALLGQSYEWID